MPETRANGHAPELVPIEPQTASDDELDALLLGLFEPVAFDIGNGRSVEIRALFLGAADRLYAGGLAGAALQRFLMARCVFVNGRPLGDANAARLPVPLANKLVSAVMAANGMDSDTAAPAEAGAEADPKA
jgi:hypothetical protein